MRNAAFDFDMIPKVKGVNKMNLAKNRQFQNR